MSMPVHAVWFGICLSGCGPATHPPCTPERLAQIEASYQAELAAKCMGQHTDCPNKPAIDAKARAAREQWVRCDPKEMGE